MNASFSSRYSKCTFQICVLGLLSVFLLGLGAHARAATDWPVLGFDPVVTNTFASPTCIAHAGDGSQRLFVVEKRGRVWIIQGTNLLAQPFLDLTNTVSSTNGMLSLAFPPGFSTNGHLYVSYVRRSDGWVVVSRFHLSSTNSNLVETNSEETILPIAKTYSSYAKHDGGQLAFGPDGFLYIGTGDGGPENDPQRVAQNPNSLLGKLLRIDVETAVSPYTVPVNNPFVGDTNYAPELWALGLRNPQTFSFDRLSGDLYIADTGEPYQQPQEVNFQPAGSPGGLNYGWRIMLGNTNFYVPAGFTNFAALVLPAACYSVRDLTNSYTCLASVTGGYVYRGPSQPRLDGLYFFGDSVNGWIWAMKRTGTTWEKRALFSPVINSPFIPFITAFGEDDQGRIYLADSNKGKIYQLQDLPQVWTPTFSPAKGILNSNIVRVTCLTLDAEIHYTTNGVDPTLADPIVVSGETIQVSTGTNKARAFRPDLNPSEVACAVFTNKVATPVFTPSSGALTNGALVSINTLTPGASIFYTTDGSSPTTNSLRYLEPIVFNTTLSIKALAAEVGYNDSAVATASYWQAQVAAPVFTPASGAVSAETGITISCATTGAVIHYTLDGSTPTVSSPVYSAPIFLNLPTTITAKAFAAGWAPSLVSSVPFGLLSRENCTVITFAGGPNSGYIDALGSAAQFSSPQGICIDPAGNLYVADTGNNIIRKITPSAQVTTFAGTGIAGSQDGPASVAQFLAPNSLCLDPAGNVYVANADDCHSIRKIDTNGIVTTVASMQPCHLATTIGQMEADPAGNVYAGWYGTLVKILPDGTSSTFAGPGPLSCSGWSLENIGVAIDLSTNLYAVTRYRIWKIAPDSSSEVWAGSSDPCWGNGFSDGPRLLARFLNPLDAAIDSSTNIFVSDASRIRKVRSDGWVCTLAGTEQSGYNDGPGSEAQFNSPIGLCVDTNGNIYVADSGNHCIRKIFPDIGIPADWQLAHFGYIGIDPKADPDHDQLNNYGEYRAGTDPLDPLSVLALGRTSLVSDGQFQIRWQTVSGKTYLIQSSDDLVSWTNLGTPVQGDGLNASLTAELPHAGQRFYRVTLSP